MADKDRGDVSGPPSEDEGREARQRQFSRREILRAGMAVPAVIAVPALAAACGGGSSSAAGHGDHTDSGTHNDHSDHTDAAHNDNSHGDSTHTDSAHTDHGTTHSDTGTTHSDTGTTHTDTGATHTDSHGDFKHIDNLGPGFNHQDQVIRHHDGANNTSTHLDHSDVQAKQ